MARVDRALIGTLMSTCPPAAVEALATRVEAAGRRPIDAPCRASPARKPGTDHHGGGAPRYLRGFAAGLRGHGDKPFHVGRRQGQGAAVKAIDQLLCGVHMAAAAEAPAFAGKLGADPQVVLQIMGGSAASSWMLRDRGPRMLEAGPEVTSAMDIFVKTWASCWRGGGMPEQRCPVAAVAHQLFLAASGGARARPTTARSIRTYHAMNGTTRQGE